MKGDKMLGHSVRSRFETDRVELNYHQRTAVALLQEVLLGLQLDSHQ